MKVDLKNFARGGLPYHAHRLDIARKILASDRHAIDELTPFLRERLFKIPAGFSSFSFVKKDWEVCDQLRHEPDPRLEAAYLAIATHYVETNVDEVRGLYDYNRRLSNRLLQAEAPALEADTDPLSASQTQSLLSIRVHCAQSNVSGQSIRNELQQLLTNSWCKGRLLYPLVYLFVEPRPNEDLDPFLDYVVPGDQANSERAALKLLLSDQAAISEPLAFKIYVSMMGHAYDVCETLIDHAELVLAQGNAPSPALLDCLSGLASLLPGTRAANFAEFIERGTANSSETNRGLGRFFDLTADELEHYTKFASVSTYRCPTDCKEGKRPFQILARMRASDLPIRDDFQRITADAYNWWFIDAGQFIVSLLRSIYMIDRPCEVMECRDALRLLEHLGECLPFLATVPSGMVCLQHLKQAGPLETLSLDDIAAATEAELVELRPHPDRLWINDFQWTLRDLESEFRIHEWLHRVRSEARLRPSYLTGINWNWVNDVISAERLLPFLNWEGAYLFLLMENESSTADPMRLRMALSKLLRDMSFEETVDALLTQFGSASPAAVRKYLSTQNLLGQGLAVNYMAALDLRIRALEECIRKVHFNEFLDEEAFETEKRTLTSELLLTNVNSGKFEVPWDLYRNDSLEAQKPLFRTFSTLSPRRSDSEEMQDVTRLMATIETPVNFPNGRFEKFRYKVYQAPLFSLLIALISDFMNHPAFGLEVILSGRFRHSNLLQELLTAMSGVENSTINHVSGTAKRRIIEMHREILAESVEDWCSTYLHTLRPEKTSGQFDLVPTQREIEALLSDAEKLSELTQIIDLVVDWIKGKLRHQVPAARQFFEEDFIKFIRERFESPLAEAKSSGRFSERDLNLVHAAIDQALAHRVAALGHWFDGVDTTIDGPITLADLAAATVVLFENVFSDRRLELIISASAASVHFDPQEVKIAFDLLREVMYNALKAGKGPNVRLKISVASENGMTWLRFSNLLAAERQKEAGEPIAGCRYDNPNEDIFRENNSGLLKVASSAATLVQESVEIRPLYTRFGYHLLLPIRRAHEKTLAA